MASTSINLFFFWFFLFIISHLTFAKNTSFRPKALFLSITKDPSTLQYITHINQRTPLVPVKLTVDVAGQVLWVDCDQYVSSSYKHVPCHSAQCSLTATRGCSSTITGGVSKPGNYNNTCLVPVNNPVKEYASLGQLGQDIVSIQSTDGLINPGKVVHVPKFILACAELSEDIEKLATGVKGVAGLGWSKTSLPAQFSTAFSFRRKFAICLPSNGNGALLFGDVLPPGIDPSKSLSYTPLIFNKFSIVDPPYEDDQSSDYFIGVKSIQISGRVVPFNTSLLSINKRGIGGTKISTAKPYTILETTIYDAVIYAFSKELAGIPKVAPIEPFGLCYDATKIGVTKVGPVVPEIDFVLQNKVKWTIFGGNSMVRVKDDVLCLGFVDGGLIVEYRGQKFGDQTAETSIVIGGHQLENNLLQFDLAGKRLGFSSSLLLRQTTCSNFNFTSKA